MATMTKVPALTMANVTNPEKQALAVQAATEAEGRANRTVGESAVFLYGAVMFTESTAQEIVTDTGAKKSALSKAGRVIRHYVDEMFPDRERTFTFDDFLAVVERIDAEYSSVFDAYRKLWPTVRVEKTLEDELARLYRKSGMDAETWGLYNLGVAETVDAGKGDEGDDDQ